MRHKLANFLKIFFMMTFVLSLGCLVACGGETKEPKVTFIVNEEEASGYINTEFDVGEIIEQEEGVEYSITATYLYVDLTTFETEERVLECDRLKFTQYEMFDVNVTVTARVGDKTATGEITIAIQPIVDLDDGIVKDYQWHDSDYYTLTINNDMTYIKDGKSSIKVNYSGSYSQPYNGNQFMFVNGDGSFRGTADNSSMNPEDGVASTVTDWSTASLVFWVYNPMDEDLRFFTRFANVSNGRRAIDMDWGSANQEKYVKRVPAHSWKLVRFELADYGITTPMQYEELYGQPGHYNLAYLNLTTDPPIIGTDVTSCKVHYEGAPESGFYQFYFYFDGFAFVDKEVADALDPNYEPVERENYGDLPTGIHSDAWQFGPSKASDTDLPAPVDNDKTIAIDVKFGSEANQDTKIAFCLRGAGGGNWLHVYGYYYIYADGTPAAEYNGFEITEIEDGWLRITIDLSVADETFGGEPLPEQVGTLTVYSGDAFTTALGYIMYMGVVD